MGFKENLCEKVIVFFNEFLMKFRCEEVLITCFNIVG